jgi:hypothetical protein
MGGSPEGTNDFWTTKGMFWRGINQSVHPAWVGILYIGFGYIGYLYIFVL